MKEKNLQNTKGWLLGGENGACDSRTPKFSLLEFVVKKWNLLLCNKCSLRGTSGTEEPGLQWQCPHPGPVLITCSEKRSLVVWSNNKSLLNITEQAEE